MESKNLVATGKGALAKAAKSGESIHQLTLPQIEEKIDKALDREKKNRRKLATYLREVRNRDLWKEPKNKDGSQEHPTFPEYCEERWNKTKWWVTDLTNGLMVLEALEGLGIKHELPLDTARLLAPILGDPDDRGAAVLGRFDDIQPKEIEALTRIIQFAPDLNHIQIKAAVKVMVEWLKDKPYQPFEEWEQETRLARKKKAFQKKKEKAEMDLIAANRELGLLETVAAASAAPAVPAPVGGTHFLDPSPFVAWFRDIKGRKPTTKDCLEPVAAFLQLALDAEEDGDSDKLQMKCMDLLMQLMDKKPQK